MKDSRDPHELHRPGYQRLSSQGGLRPHRTGCGPGSGEHEVGLHHPGDPSALSSLLGWGSPSSDASVGPAAGGVGRQGKGPWWRACPAPWPLGPQHPPPERHPHPQPPLREGAPADPHLSGLFLMPPPGVPSGHLRTSTGVGTAGRWAGGHQPGRFRLGGLPGL